MHILKIKRIDEGEELNIVAYLNLDWYIFGENLCHLDYIVDILPSPVTEIFLQ